MANHLTHKGQDYMLFGDGTSSPNLLGGSIARLATAVRLYTSASTPNKDGTGFTQVANGNGYATGGSAITVDEWTLETNSGDRQIKLDDVIVTASGGNIENIAGAYIVDTDGNVLAWWERSLATTLVAGDSITLDDLTIKLQSAA
jgi:hypothetical protein